MLLVTLMLLTSCGPKTDDTVKKDNPPNDASQGTTTQPEQPKEIVRKEQNGLYGADNPTLNYLTQGKADVTDMIYTLVEGLLDYDEYGLQRPNMAVSYEVSEDKLTYTFKLRKGVKWYTCEKQEYADVTANDFVFAMKYLLTKDNNSETANIVYSVIENAEKYYNAEITDFSQVGIKAIDEYTLQYKLIKPTPWFVDMLSYTCWYPVNEKFVTEVGADAFGTTNDTLLYNGAYIFTTWRFEDLWVREMNENYWNKDNIFVSKRTHKFNKSMAELAPDLFLKGEITTAAVPAAVTQDWLNDPEKSKLMMKEFLSPSQFSLYMNFAPAYDDKHNPENWVKAVNNINFRKSLAFAVDRNAFNMTIFPIGYEDVLSTQLLPKGFVSVNGKDYADLDVFEPFNSYEKVFNVEKANEYKQKAMEELKGKVTFPVKLVYPHTTNTAPTNRAIIFEQFMEKNLGTDYIDVICEAHPPTGYIENVMDGSKFSLLMMGWGPDYKDPYTYLSLYSRPELGGLGNDHGHPFLMEEDKGEGSEGYRKFEEMIKVAADEVGDLNKRYELFAQAEAHVLDQAFVIPLFTDGGGYYCSYVHPYSYNFSQFAQTRDFTKNIRIMDAPVGAKEQEEAKVVYDQERAEALKNPNKYWDLEKERNK